MLETDASKEGLGAVLTQRHEDNTVHPIAYASRSLQPHEKNYGISELEALGVVWAVRHFLYGHQCDVYTDHEALKSLINTPHPSGKLARWGLALQDLNLEIHYRPRKRNANADALSRAPVEPHPSRPFTIVAAINANAVQSKDAEPSPLATQQQEDPTLRAVINYLTDGILPPTDKEARELVLARDQYSMIDGVLYRLAADNGL